MKSQTTSSRAVLHCSIVFFKLQITFSLWKYLYFVSCKYNEEWKEASVYSLLTCLCNFPILFLHSDLLSWTAISLCHLSERRMLNRMKSCRQGFTHRSLHVSQLLQDEWEYTMGQLWLRLQSGLSTAEFTATKATSWLACPARVALIHCCGDTSLVSLMGGWWCLEQALNWWTHMMGWWLTSWSQLNWPDTLRQVLDVSLLLHTFGFNWKRVVAFSLLVLIRHNFRTAGSVPGPSTCQWIHGEDTKPQLSHGKPVSCIVKSTLTYMVKPFPMCCLSILYYQKQFGHTQYCLYKRSKMSIWYLALRQ